MFNKEGSSISRKGKKGKDAPLRKSDRRKLRDRFLSSLHLPSEPISAKAESSQEESDGIGNDINSLTSGDGLKPLLENIFNSADSDILARKLKRDEKTSAGAVTLYLRTPSTICSKGSNGDGDREKDAHGNASILSQWPYSASTQAILIEMEHPHPSTPFAIKSGNGKKHSHDDAHSSVLLPTLALLSVLPPPILDHLPTITVPSMVTKYLCRGADLMRSGIFRLPAQSTLDRSRGVVMLRVQTNIQPFALGFVTPGTSETTIGVGQKGVGVRVVTCYGDDIWRNQCSNAVSKGGKVQKGDNSVSIQNPMGGGLYNDGNYGNVGFVDGKVVYGFQREQDENDSDLEEDDMQPLNQSDVPPNTGIMNNDDGQDLPQSQVETNHDKCSERSNEVKEYEKEQKQKEEEGNDQDVVEEARMDSESILFKAFYTSILSISSKSDLPMPISTYFTNFLLPARPEGTTVDIKSTKYKKIGTFLLEQAKRGVISIGASKDGKDPVAFLTGIEKGHIDLREARRDRKEKQSASEGNDTNNASQKKKLAVANLYIIPSNIASLMRLQHDAVKAADAKSEERRGTGYLTAPECRNILNEYIIKNDLIDEFDPELVTLDGPLCDALFRRSKKQAASAGNVKMDYPDSLTRKELNSKWLERMEDAFAIVSMPGNVIINMKRGKPAFVLIEVEARQNRKKFITRVRGLEEYGIDGSAFANDVSKRFACSATVEDDPSGRAALKKGHVEVIFQGHLVDELKALLTGDEKLSFHGGAKGGDYHLPKGVIKVDLKKGVPAKKRR